MNTRPTKFPGSRMLRSAIPNGYGVQYTVLEDGTIYSAFTFDLAKEGPPGFAHGGAVASVLDEAMGTACFEAERLGFTATMTVNFRMPAPLNEILEVRAQVTTTEEKKTFVSSQVQYVDGRVIADATAIFIVSQRLRELIQADGDNRQDL